MKPSVPATPRAGLNGGSALPGATGLIGAALVDRLRAARHQVRVVRPQAPLIPARFAGCAAVVHLAGESGASGRWTAADVLDQAGVVSRSEQPAATSERASAHAAVARRTR